MNILIKNEHQRLALASIAVAVLVTALKFLAFHRTGSVAFYSDALESVVNVVTGVTLLIALDLARRPADRRHQFGHHKVEYVSAVIEGVLIVIAAFVILRDAYEAVHAPRAVTNLAAGMGASLLATLFNALWSWALVARGRAVRSPAIVAQGWHLFSDVATSIGVIAGVGLSVATGWHLLDPLLAAGVAVYILWSGARIIRDSMSGLLDEAVTSDVARRIRAIITANAGGALEAHDIRTRTAGPATFIEFHLVVPGRMTVAAAHDICNRIERALDDAIPDVTTVIHIEPEGEAVPSGAVVI